MNIRENVINVLCGVNSQIKENLLVDLLEEGYIDSFEIVNIVMELESIFDIEIEPEDITPENFSNINSIVSLIEEVCSRNEGHI